MKYKDEKWLREKYEDHSMQEMADMIGCSTATIHKYMNKFGIERPDDTKAKGGKHTEKQWLRQKYVGEKLSQKEIADLCGVGKGTIKYWLDKHGIEIRDKSEAAKIRTKSHPHTTQNACTQDPTFYNRRGYEIAACPTNDSHVELHRLLATLMVDDIGELQGMHVHHKHGARWLNYEDGLEIMTPGEHTKLHWEERKKNE